MRYYYHLIVILLILSGCKAAKDSSAVERVTASRSLLNRVKPSIDSLWPCINDTSLKFKKGRIDSVPFNVYVPILIDTVDRNAVIDSIVSIIVKTKQDSTALAQQQAYLRALKEAYTQGFKAAEKKYANVKVPVSTPDTVINTINDTRKLDIANSSRFSALLQLSASQSAADNFKKERNILFFIVLALILGVGVGLFFKLKP